MKPVDAAALAALSVDELRIEYGAVREPEPLRALAMALTAWELDPSIRAYVATLGAERQQAVTELLLAVRGSLSPDDRTYVYACIAEAIEGYWCGFTGFTDVLARQLDGPSLDPLVLPRLRRAIFCTDLLLSLAAQQSAVPATWVTEIRRRRVAEDFVEHPSDLVHALRRLDLALAGLPA